ncbi:outer membrane protein Iml2/Tetratricopeptide repeat protein 39 [Cladochytrium replicatum]|nr:outer membrane protein Iml2/Tetratricopeptide repeat protein 39 [Cladochytrium replicatum]
MHALAAAAMEAVQALVSFAPDDVQRAMHAFEHAERLCDATIHLYAEPRTVYGLVSSGISAVGSGLSSISSMFSTASSSSSVKSATPRYMPNGLLRAWVIKAECNLIMSVLQLLNESMLALLRAGFQIRKGYKAYQKVWAEYQKHSEFDLRLRYDRNTITAVQLGIGLTNVLLASLPHKILSLVSVLGLKGDKELGFKLLQHGAVEDTIRAPLVTMFLLVIHGMLPSFAPAILSPQDVPIGEKVLSQEFSRHPDSTMHLYFGGRLMRVKGDLDASNAMFKRSISAQDWWKEIHHLCYYELTINAGFRLDWGTSEHYSEKLLDENMWSKAAYAYMLASSKVMMGKPAEDYIPFFKKVPSLVVRKYAGKHLLLEQYVMRKVKQYERDDFKFLLLPGLEIIFIWNGFAFMQRQHLEESLAMIDDSLLGIEQWLSKSIVIEDAADAPESQSGKSILVQSQKLAKLSSEPKFVAPPRDTTWAESVDRSALLHLMRAVVLRELGKYVESREEHAWISDHAAEFKEEAFVVPFGLYELAVLKFKEGDIQGSQKTLTQAGGIHRFDFENRLALRLHLASSRLEETESPKK